MSPLERLRYDQNNDLVFPSDAALTVFLAETDPVTVYRDLEPVTDVERRHLNRIRSTA